MARHIAIGQTALDVIEHYKAVALDREWNVQYRWSWAVLLVVGAIMLTACGSGGGASDDSEPTAEDTPDGIFARDAWVRPAVLPEGSPTPDPSDDESGSGVISALYFTIENHTNRADQLVGVETDIARVVEIHETRNEGGLMRMRHVEAVEVPAGGEVAFEPGGHHVMLIDITRPLDPGTEIAVTLNFSSGEQLELPAVPVQDS